MGWMMWVCRREVAVHHGVGVLENRGGKSLEFLKYSDGHRRSP